MKYLLAGFLLLHAVAGNSQKILTPGKDAFEGKWIKADSTDMIWYRLLDTSKIEIGVINTKTVFNQDNVIIITRVNLKNAKGPLD